MAKAKNPTQNSPYIWRTVMFAHCMIHAGFVYLITRQLTLAIFQLISHFVIDYAKCKDLLSNDPNKAFAIDQIAHLWVLAIIAILYCSPA